MSLTVFAGCGKEESVSLNGSTSMEKVVGVLSEKFQEDNKNIKVTYDPTGSGTGIEAVKNGTCDIGLSSRNLKSDETGLTATVVAKDGIAIIVNSQNSVSDLSVDKIAAVFTGEIKNRKELGGEGIGYDRILSARQRYRVRTDREDILLSRGQPHSRLCRGQIRLIFSALHRFYINASLDFNKRIYNYRKNK